MDRVAIIRAFLNIFIMQVCVEKGATDEEILEACNRENPSGTINGWVKVVRSQEDFPNFGGEKPPVDPVTCMDDPNREHLLVLC